MEPGGGGVVFCWASCYGNWAKRLTYGPQGLNADFTHVAINILNL